MTPQTSRKRGGPLAAPARLPYVAQVRRLLDRFARDGSARWAWHNPEPPEPRLRHHGGWLTPYTAQAIIEDALGAGRGARLEVTVPSHISSVRLARLLDQFAPLGARGVHVSVRRDDPPGVTHPDAAA